MIKTTITINKGLVVLDHLPTVHPLDSTPIPLETGTLMTAGHLPSHTDTVTFGPSPISPLLERLGRRYGVRRSRTRMLRKTAALNERRLYRLNLRIR